MANQLCSGDDCVKIEAYKCEVCGRVYESIDGYDNCQAIHNNEYKKVVEVCDVEISVECKRDNVFETFEVCIAKDQDEIWFEAEEWCEFIKVVKDLSPSDVRREIIASKIARVIDK